MDHRGTKLLTFAALTLAVTAASAAPKENRGLSALAWLEPRGALQALSNEPDRRLHVRSSENPAATDDPGSTKRRWQQISAGEILFHTPILLGGQAAKAGISCASCHVNGRDNAHFQFPGVSHDPGTADVTHSFFSSFRGDDHFNPVSIPDLTRPGKISHENPEELEKFIRGLIVEEFDGQEPGNAALTALAAYVRALRPCDGCSPRPLIMTTHLGRVKQALSAAVQIEASEQRLSHLLIGGARTQLSLIHERYADKKLARERTAITKLSVDLATLQDNIGVRSARYYQLHRKATDQIQALRKLLADSESRSLYNPERLEAYLEKHAIRQRPTH